MKGKLVRDRIPEIIRDAGRTPVTRTLDPTAYEQALRDKLLEEADEDAAASGPEPLEELADVLEVVRALVVSSDTTWLRSWLSPTTRHESADNFSPR